MKKIKLMLFTMLAMFVSTVGVHAACDGTNDATKYYSIDGGKYCATLEEAVNNVSNNGTIKLLKEDNTIRSRFDLSFEKNITLDLNGNTISGNVSGNTVLKLQKGTLTITDNNNGNGKITNNVGGGILVTDGATLILEKGTIETNGAVATVQVGSTPSTGPLTGSFILNNGKLANKYTVVSQNSVAGHALYIVNGSAKINNGTVTSSTTSTIAVGDSATATQTTGKLEINNGTIDNTNSTYGLSIILVNGKTDVNGGTVTSAVKGSTVQVGQPSGPDTVEFNLNGGKIENTNTESGIALFAARGTTNIKKGNVVNANASATIQVGDSSEYNAKVIVDGGNIENKGNTASVALLIPYGGSEAVINGGTIKVNEDAEYNLAMIIGVNNQKLVEGKQAGEKAKVTINNGDITGGIALFGQKPELNISGGNITSKTFAVSGNGSPEGSENATIDSKITISGGNLTSTGSAAIYHPQKGTLNITGGTITGELGIVARSGKVNISGNATINANGDPNKTYRVGDAKEGNDYVQLPGGTGVIVDNSENSYPDDAKVSITNGNFNTKGAALLAYKNEENNDDEIVVSGGTFNKDVEKVYLASNDLGQSESGVVGKLHKIQINKTENGKVEAYANAAEGEEVIVKLIANKGYKLDKLTILDKDGKEVKFVSAEGGVKFTMPTSDVTISATFKKVAATETEENPKTGDNILMYLGLGLASVAVATLSIKKLRKSN